MLQQVLPYDKLMFHFILYLKVSNSRLSYINILHSISIKIDQHRKTRKGRVNEIAWSCL